MKKTTMKRFGAAGKKLLAALAVCAAVLVLLFSIFTNDGGRYALKASAYSLPKLAVHRYDIEMTVNENRKIDIKEKIVVEFLQDGLTMFYRSLPLEKDMYKTS